MIIYFVFSTHVETVVQLSREKVDDYIEVDLDTAALEGKAGASASYKQLRPHAVSDRPPMYPCAVSK